MPSITHANVAAFAQQDGYLDFKYEGENAEGLPFGPLTLHSSGEPVYPGGHWVTKREALRLAEAWGIELFEY